MDTNLSLPNKRSGKVRDLYDVAMPNGDEALLIIATDRISAFDVVMANGLPGKGVVLTQISRFWFDHFADEVPHHLISTDVADIPGLSDDERRDLAGRVTLCRKTEVLPVECIARGYLAGSGWKDYQRSGAVCGIELPKSLDNGDRLEEPIFTPSTKADTGHDENISFDEGAAIVGHDTMRWLGDTTLSLYSRAREYALERGIILADTKFEFGTVDGAAAPLLIDEIFTPGQLSLLAPRRVGAGRRAAEFRQAIRAQLPGDGGGGRPLGQDTARPRTAGKGARRHHGALSRSL